MLVGSSMENHISHEFKFYQIRLQTVELAALVCLKKIPVELEWEHVFKTLVLK